MSPASTAGSTGATLASTGAGVWPDNWRDRVANGDAKVLSRLARYASPDAALAALNSLQEKVARGELRSALPKDATPEQIKAHNAEHGIPESPDKYELKLKDGLVVGKDDKPFVDEFLKGLHGAGMNNAQASAAVNWYYDMQDAQSEAQATKDSETARASEDVLREEWGKEFRPNMNLMHSLLDMAPPGLKDLLLHGRLSDRPAIGSSPAALRWLVGLAREINPAGALTGASGTAGADSIETEINGIEKTMREDRAAYNKDEKMQARYRELLGARDSLKARAA